MWGPRSIFLFYFRSDMHNALESNTPKHRSEYGSSEIVISQPNRGTYFANVYVNNPAANPAALFGLPGSVKRSSDEIHSGLCSAPFQKHLF